ncbi:MAG: hypothetical protein C5B50_07820 [Verrucomicrobia bacterium]|nr:MAG: hypothetical protein C5B50_07820 [Verrucomicrobiota bacterium]
MNIILNPSQSDTKRGDINLLAKSDLTGKENLLWKIVNDGGVAKFDLPGSQTDFAIYVGASGDVAGNNVAAEAPGMEENFRVVLKGACNPGDQLVLSTDWGKVYVPAGGAGAKQVIAIAEEAGTDGQLVKARRIGAISVTF